MVDPRERDPRYPNRPNTEAFFRLSNAIQQMDGNPDLAETLLDKDTVEALEYIAKNQLATVSQILKVSIPRQLLGLFVRAWLTAYVLGRIDAMDVELGDQPK